jgi:hypothetical protein
MRNTPYPRYTIGNKNHKVFDLAETRGLIQGIVGISDLVEIKASELSKFELTPQGQIKIFDAEEKIEVVSFGGEEVRGGFVSKLEVQALNLEAGAKITGPLAWRIVDDLHPCTEVRSTGGLSGRETLVMLAILMAIIGLIAYLAPVGAAVLLGFFAVLGVALYAHGAYQEGKKRNIAKMGSIYVFAPSTRTWAA